MESTHIARGLSEDIYFNNGILIEETLPSGKELAADWIINDRDYGSSKIVTISKNDLLDASSFPHITKGIVLPDFMVPKDTNYKILYGLIRNLFQESDTLNVRVRQGAITAVTTPDFKIYPYKLVKGDNPIFYESWPYVVIAFRTKTGSVSIETIIRLARARVGQKFNPAEWIEAVGRNFDLANVLTDLPTIFNEYYGLINDQANIILLTSGEYGSGLYVIPTVIEMGGQTLDWEDAIERFTKNTMGYLKRQPEKEREKGYENIQDRIRLLFRKYMEGSNQGQYIHRALLDPDQTIRQFANATSLDEFVKNYQQQNEDLIRQLKIICEAHKAHTLYNRS